MARQGKIARLPHHLREQVNTRLLNGETARELLAWLNAEKEADAVWWQHFEGAPANPQNLSEWRLGGFKDWLKDRARVDKLKALSAFSLKAVQAGGNISDAAASIAAGELLETLTEISDARDVLDPEERDKILTNMVDNIAKIRRGDRAKEKATLSKRKENNREKQMRLDREKFETLTVEKFIQWGRSKEAQKILNSNKPKSIQTEELRKLIWGDLTKH